jgi:hypothetical protein
VEAERRKRISLSGLRGSRFKETLSFRQCTPEGLCFGASKWSFGGSGVPKRELGNQEKHVTRIQGLGTKSVATGNRGG